MTTPPEVVAALKHVQESHPEVVQVFYGVDGRWQFLDIDFNAPKFGGEVRIGLLEAAAAVVPYPSAFTA